MHTANFVTVKIMVKESIVITALFIDPQVLF